MTLAHRGVLFLDELGEFPPSRARRAAPAARGAGRAHLAPGAEPRVPGRVPAHRLHQPVPVRARRPPAAGAASSQRARYRRRLSAPLLDRFDLRLRSPAPEPGDGPGESSAVVRARVAARGRAPAGAAARHAVAAQRARPRRRARPLRPAPGRRRRRVAMRSSRSATSPVAARPRIRRVARTLADLDGPRRHRRHARARRGRAPRGRAVSAPVLDPAAATRRGRGRDARVPPRHDPGAAAARCSSAGRRRRRRWRRSGAAMRAQALGPTTTGASARWPGELARRWASTADDSRSSRSCAGATRVVLRRRRPTTRSTKASPTGPRVLLAEGDAPDVLDRPRVPIVGTRPRRRTASPTRASSARISPAPASPW